MLSKFLLVAFIFDSSVFIYILLKAYTERGKNKDLKKAFKENAEKTFLKGKNNAEKVGIIIAILIFALFLIFIGSLPFVMLVVDWIKFGFLTGLRSFLAYSLLWPMFNAIRRSLTSRKTVSNEKQRLTIIMFLSGVYIGILYTMFGFNFELFDVAYYYLSSNIAFSNSLSILMSTLTVVSVILSFYAVISKIALENVKKNDYPHWTMKYPFIITIIVLSSYGVLIFFTELTTLQKLLLDLENLNSTIEIYKDLLAAALIPLIIGVFLNVNSENKYKGSYDSNDDTQLNSNKKEINEDGKISRF
jgi:hypothetical protein